MKLQPLKVALLLAGLMVVASIAGALAQLTSRAGSAAPPLALETAVPTAFGAWRLASSGTAQVVNPQTRQILDKLYSQILTRTYVNPAGHAVMLSIAYGSDQRGELQAHRPEVCYPAQGFSLQSRQTAQISTSFGELNVTQLDTALGNRREPVTYWFIVGGASANTRLEKRWQELRLALTGRVPDGLVFRVSSIDSNPAHAHAIHGDFVRELLGAVSPDTRQRLSGLHTPQIE